MNHNIQEENTSEIVLHGSHPRVSFCGRLYHQVRPAPPGRPIKTYTTFTPNNWNQAFTLRAGGQKTGQDGQGEASDRAWCWLLWPHHRCRTHSQGIQGVDYYKTAIPSSRVPLKRIFFFMFCIFLPNPCLPHTTWITFIIQIQTSALSLYTSFWFVLCCT